MEFTYTLRASDGKEYGPVTLVQIVAWIHEGRAGEFSEIRRSDMDRWAMARDFAELKFLFTATEPVPAPAAPETITPPPGTTQDATLVSQMKSGASWFYWVAAVSLVNSLLTAFGKGFHFVLGLGITTAFDLIGAEFGAAGKMIALLLNLVVAGILVTFGVLGSKGRLWPFIVGLVVLALDGVLFLLARDWLGVGFHALVLFFLYRGMQACRALNTQ